MARHSYSDRAGTVQDVVPSVTATADNRRFYEETVFDYWASRTALTAVEEVLVERFLDKDAKTVEAGTGGGRILFALGERGFGDLHGFDYVPRFIEVARRRDQSGSIEFTVQDAIDLGYRDAEFDQAVYLQQVLCFIEDPADRMRAMGEAARVLKPGGTALFSFLCYEGRMNRPLYAGFTRYLRFQRRLRRRDVSLQYQPWLKRADKPNLGALADRRPYVYWYRFHEALDLLDHAGFDVRWIASTAQIERGHDTGFDPWRGDLAALDGMLYVACRRR
jgi:ubiquinone/menaquinone biosynthesis C-methylase UbiE